MPVLERLAPVDALAARRSLRAQIARLEGELARILASTYPPLAPLGPETAGRRRTETAERPRTETAERPRTETAERPRTETAGARRAPESARRGPSPRLLDLAALERVRDDLAGRVARARRQCEDQRRSQERARAKLAAMYVDPARHKGAKVTDAELGLPGCTTYRVVPRLLAGWWRVKVSSGCPLPSAASP